MRAWRIATGLSISWTIACGGVAELSRDDGAGGAGVEGGAGFARGGAPGASRGGAPGASGAPGAGTAGAYRDPGCPAVPPPPPRQECDPLASTASGCPAGYACYPYVEHPFGRGCGIATFGATCVREGTGVQGDLCGQGTPGCAAGHLCVIGSRSGRRCAQICAPGNTGDCPAGMICGETDIQAYGVCS